VTLSVDLRSADAEVLAKAHEQFLAVVDGLNAAGEVEVDIDSMTLRPSSAFQAEGWHWPRRRPIAPGCPAAAC